MQRTSIYLDAPDRTALSVIKEAYGIATDAAAIRLAVREMARQLDTPQPRRQRRPRETIVRNEEGNRS